MKGTKEDFKWFGEGFDGFPKTLPEDCVEYTLYIIDSKLDDLEKREQLRKVQHAGLRLNGDLTKDFIWQREAFNLALERDGRESYLRGRTNYGDSVEDEWLILYILRELSREFPQIWVRVIDTDGQFLLIEAAGVLPRWLNPEVADFRVWLNDGNLLIVPFEEPEGKATRVKAEPKSLNLQQALDFIRNNRSRLINSPTIQAEAFYRLQKYPQQISDSLHQSLVMIPRKLAYVLHQNASYISSAVEAFYLRDPIALRPLQARGSTELTFPPHDLVTISAKFTKVGYAQLKSQQFDTPASWNHISHSTSGLKRQKGTEVGMKVTCGFEMLMSDPQNQDKKAVREIKLLLDDLQAEEEHLPSDADVSKWNMKEDDEGWLDINFEDFEKELGGKGRQGLSGMDGGFGDKGAQDNLRKMVERFEEFLNDDTAGSEGAEFMDVMDEDDEEDDTNSDDSEEDSEDKDISFDEDEFTDMMREMMGMPSNATITNSKSRPEDETPDGERVTFFSSREEDDHDLLRDMQIIEHELREAGALDLNPKQDVDNSQSQQKAIDTRSSVANQPGAQIAAVSAEKDAEDEDLDIDLNLAKNLLESFKSQGSASGPGSNLMGLMGMQLPRDEREQG